MSHLILRYSYMSGPFSLLNLFYPTLRNRSVSFFSLLFLYHRTLSNISVAFFSLLFLSRFTLSNRSVTFFSQLYSPRRSFKNMSALFSSYSKQIVYVILCSTLLLFILLHETRLCNSSLYWSCHILLLAACLRQSSPNSSYIILPKIYRPVSFNSFLISSRLLSDGETPAFAV